MEFSREVRRVGDGEYHTIFLKMQTNSFLPLCRKGNLSSLLEIETIGKCLKKRPYLAIPTPLCSLQIGIACYQWFLIGGNAAGFLCSALMIKFLKGNVESCICEMETARKGKARREKEKYPNTSMLLDRGKISPFNGGLLGSLNRVALVALPTELLHHV